jgi:aminopeptidase N
MMRDFYQTHQGRRASTEDFRRTVERHTKADMGWFFDQWVHSSGIPTYRVGERIEPTGDGRFQVRLRVRQENVPDDFLAYVPVTLELGKDQKVRFRVKVKGPRTEVVLGPVPAKPREVRFNDLEGVLAEVKTERWEE